MNNFYLINKYLSLESCENDLNKSLNDNKIDVKIIEKKFNFLLKNTLEFISFSYDQPNFINLYAQQGDILKDFIEYKQLSKKLQNLTRRIQKIDANLIKDNKFYDQVVIGLDQRIYLSLNLLKQRGGLPISYKRALSSKKQAYLHKLQLEYLTHKACLRVEQEAFHFLWNDVLSSEGVNLDQLESNTSARAFLSVQSLLRYSGLALCKPFLMDRIKEATVLALKLDLLYSYSSKEKLSSYYKTINQLNQSEKLVDSQEENLALLEDCKDLLNRRIPKEVLITDICLAILKDIETLEDKEWLYLPVGTKEHAVLVQISCSLNPLLKEKIYCYTLFNTGELSWKYHFNRFNQQDQEEVKPLTIRYLSQKAFSYEWCEQLINCEMNAQTMAKFYRIQKKYLITKGCGVKDQGFGEWYPKQNFGICTRTSIEMGIFHQLNKNEKNFFNLAKAAVAKEKLQIVIGLRNRKKLLNMRKKKSNPPKLAIELEQSKRLLQVGKHRLRKYRKLTKDEKIPGL